MRACVAEFKSFSPFVSPQYSAMWGNFVVWLLLDPEWGVIRYARSEKTKKVVQDVIDAYQSVLDGKVDISDVNWQQLYDAANNLAGDIITAANAKGPSWNFEKPTAEMCTAMSDLQAVSAAEEAAMVGRCLTSKKGVEGSIVADWAFETAYCVAGAAAYANGDTGTDPHAQPTRSIWQNVQTKKLLELVLQG